MASDEGEKAISDEESLLQHFPNKELFIFL